MNITYLAIYKQDIIGYVSILADSIRCKTINNSIKTIYPNYPAIKIGRLAVNEKYKRRHVGTSILDSTCKLIKKISKRIGVGFIPLDAYCCARQFYLNNEFKYMPLQNPKKLKRIAKMNPTTSIPMYKNIEKIKE